jgi:hypothetical protein
MAKEAGIGQAVFSSKCARIGYVANGVFDGLSDAEVAVGGGWALDSKVPMKHYLTKHTIVEDKMNAARDRRAELGNKSVPYGAWARCGVNGESSLSLADVRLMAQEAGLRRNSLANSASSSR